MIERSLLMKTNSKKFSIKDWFEKNKLYILAFVLPILSMLIVYYFKNIFPFGDQMYLRSDCYHQYTPYLEILQQKLKDGGSLFYTWEIGAGMNFMAVAAYYLTSPLNLLAIIWPGYMADMVSFFIVLKMGLAGFSVCYYLTKRFGQKNISSVVFGMAYALSAYFAAFSWNIMWLDCMWLLPFIVLGLEKLVNEKKCKMYCISLALAIFSNYYIGLMICIFSIIYFVYLFCIVEFDETVEKTKARLLILKDYAIYSILGGALAACVILPEYFSLLTTKSADSSFPTTLEETVSMLYMIFRSLICIPVADLKYYPEPNIYCSVAIFILIPLFWMCKKINVKERIGKTVIALIMLLSFGLNIPAYIWHGFHFPNSLPCRQSFLYIFLILTMCYEAFLYIREYEPKHIAWATGGSVALVFLLDQLFKDASIFSDLEIETSIVKIIYFSLLFIVVYACLIVWYKKAPKLKPFLSYLMVLIVFCELTLNMNVTGIPSTSGRKGYYEATKAYDQLNNITKKDADSQNVKYYRTESAVHTTRNDGARFNYNSISTFSSVLSANIQDYFDSMGLQTSYNACSYYGHTPLTASLFSIKYEYSTGEPSLPNNVSLLNSASYNLESGGNSTVYAYEYNNTLPLGFLINSSSIAKMNSEAGDPFTMQNNFVTSAVNGGQMIFHRLKTDGTNSITAQYNLEENDTANKSGTKVYDVYFYCETSAETLTATVSNGSIQDKSFVSSSVTTSTSKTFDSANQNYICHLGNVPEGATISISASDNTAISAMYAYAFDETAWEYDYNLLNANPYQVTSFSDTKIEGTLTTDKGNLLYTSIPYDKGWSVYVDGQKANTTAICKGALTGVMVTAGTHQITFKYTPRGFFQGIIISIISLLILLGLIFKDRILELITGKKKGSKVPSNKPQVQKAVANEEPKVSK